MILISKYERAELERVGLLKHKKTGRFPQDPNFQVVNKQHCSRDKSVYVAEEPDVLAFLGKWDYLNLQRISNSQKKQLIEGGFLNSNNIQKWGEYVPNAIAYEDKDGQWRIKKITKLLLFLGIWKNKKPTNNYNNSYNNNYNNKNKNQDTQTEV